MNTLVSISNLRKKIFKYADLVEKEDYEIEVERNGKRIFKIVKVEENPEDLAKEALKVARRLGGTWKKDIDDKFFRGKKEKDYFSNLENW
ncbi:hypothetical protein A2771_01910 [Candidatus Woesebacteria bacterium RIFCSPHIGHO2_01_FULL_38_26b]|uniref:Antitoxin n=1 Tax=Candidatus Woesebacteria bacterium RIFCSPHIGHO2_01_FULL_38_26b TaxID=1802491 RepID=A0A1F7XXH3_9BACT|nr:MAG: hypothetical protein A2771_01910 [Candidatus Woesebacteria bacterium RIFCSPHIGHO2_01_FULL_38_26b]